MPSTPTRGPVIVTGAGSGIGAATARRLAERGHVVYATARRVETLSPLTELGARALPLDVTDEESRRSAVDAVVAEHGHVAALVNNAGYGAYGAVEEIPLADVRAQFETNVFGALRLTQLVLPSMRDRGAGRIVNISSMGGRLTFPFGGAYHASKHAVEAFSDALRIETARFGVRVAVVEPGLIVTRFGETAAGTLSAATPAGSPYAADAAAVDAAMARSYGNTALTAGPDAVAKAVVHAIEAANPRTRYVITPAARALVSLRAVTPGRVWDVVARRQLGLAR